jgi:dTDP-4-amino-4,6-dideoxygalactose transaminase
MHLQPVFEAYEFIGVGVADLLFESGVCLPSGFQLTPSEHHEICSIIKEVLLETL